MNATAETQVLSLEADVVDAVVLEVVSDAVRVRLPDGSIGSAPLEDFGRGDHLSVPASGDAIRVFVEHKHGQLDEWVVSKDKGARLDAFQRAFDAFQKGETIEGEIVAAVEGGFAVDIGVKAFLPASQIGTRAPRSVDSVLGQRLEFRILRFNEKRHNIVLSRRVLLEEARDKALERLEPGNLVEGIVRSFTDYGAFVDVGGVEGLLHVSDMRWGRVGHPSTMLAVGQHLTLVVLSFDKETKRLSLGLRQVTEDPWLGAHEKYVVGNKVKGIVVSKTDYGCFIEVESGIEGLVHSKGPMVTAEARKFLDKIEIGEEMEGVVLDLDVPRRRLSLTVPG